MIAICSRAVVMKSSSCLGSIVQHAEQELELAFLAASAARQFVFELHAFGNVR